MAYRLVWTVTAVRDLRAVRDYIAAQDPSAARAVGRKILDAAANLTQHPAIGRAGRVPDTRELMIAGLPFILPYTVDENRVVILAVLHGARRWPEDFGAAG